MLPNHQTHKNRSLLRTRALRRRVQSPFQWSKPLLDAPCVVKGEISGSESLYHRRKSRRNHHLTDSRVTIGRNGSVAASISAREVVILGKVHGNIQVTDRLDSPAAKVRLTGTSSLSGLALKTELFLRAACRSAPSNTRMLRDRPSGIG